MGCKIRDKKDSTATLGHSPILSVDDAPRDLTLIAFNHPCVCPLPAIRCWNFGLSDFLKHGSKISPFVA